MFRGKFLALLRAAFDHGRLSFHGKLAALANPDEFQRRLTAIAQTEWVVHAKPPFGGPEQVLKYLARYTHRAAISNRRLIRLEGDEVEFLWKNYARGGERKTMTLNAVEFIRRFLLHVLPSGFVRMRHYGFLANRVCQEKLAQCRALLAAETTAEPVAADPAPEPVATVATSIEAPACPVCGRGRLMITATLRTPDETRGAGERDSPQGRRRYVLKRAVAGKPPDVGGGAGLNPHRRGVPRGSVQRIVSEVPRPSLVRAELRVVALRIQSSALSFTKLTPKTGSGQLLILWRIVDVCALVA